MSGELIGAINLISKKPQTFGMTKKWDSIDPTTKSIALSMFDFGKKKLESCPLCGRYQILTGTWTNPFGTERVCGDCDDGPRYHKEMERFNSI